MKTTSKISVKKSGGKILISIDEKDWHENSFEDFYDAMMSKIVLQNDEFVELK